MLGTLSTVFPGFGNFTEIGRGGFSAVFRAVHTKIRDLEIAIKVVNKYEILSADDRRNFEYEVEILKRLDFPFIITFYDLRENNEFFFISMELAKNGTLLEMINSKKQLDNETSMRIFCQLSATLYYLHNVINSIHRDIKVENIMFDDKMNLRLIDFGFSQMIKNKSKDSAKGKNKKIFTTLCGSYPYAAPEMLRLSPYSKPVDIWALGIVLYVCIVGKLPFDDPSIPKLAKMIVFNEPNYPEGIDEGIQSLLKKLLTKNPSERPTIEEVREYDLIKNSPYKIFFDVIGNENFMIRNFSTQNENNSNENPEEEVRDVYLDAEIIENLVKLGLDPTNVLVEGTEEMLLYRAQRKKKIEEIIGNDQLFKETLNQKNIPQKLLVQVTYKKKNHEQQQAQQQAPQQTQQPQQQVQTQAQRYQQPIQSRSQQQLQQQYNQAEAIQGKAAFKSTSHVDFIFNQQQAQQNQQRRTTPRQNQNQNTNNQDDDIFPNYQNYKQIKANQQSTRSVQQMQQQQQQIQQNQLQNQPNQQQSNQASLSGNFSSSNQQFQQSLQAQIQQQVQIQLQQKPSPQTIHPQSQPQTQPFPFHVSSQRCATAVGGTSEAAKSIARIGRNKHRSSSVATIIKQPQSLTLGTQIVTTPHQPIGKCSSTGQPCSQISFQGSQNQQLQGQQQTQIMIIQKKRRAPSLGSHVPSFQVVSTNAPNAGNAGPPSTLSDTDRSSGGHSKKIRSSTSYATDQADPSTPTSAGGRSQVHSQATSTGREVAPIMRPRKKSGKGHFISIISK